MAHEFADLQTAFQQLADNLAAASQQVATGSLPPALLSLQISELVAQFDNTRQQFLIAALQAGFLLPKPEAEIDSLTALMAIHQLFTEWQKQNCLTQYQKILKRAATLSPLSAVPLPALTSFH